MDLQAYYRVKRPEVVSEIIDGEAVVINLEKGIYYSIDGSGAVIWGHFEAGATVQYVIDDLCVQYTGERSDITRMVGEFVQQLVHEELLISGVTPTQPKNAINGTSAQTKPDFVAPVLEKFTDMEALLLLDPIHEVNEQGWPTSADNAQN